MTVSGGQRLQLNGTSRLNAPLPVVCEHLWRPVDGSAEREPAPRGARVFVLRGAKGDGEDVVLVPICVQQPCYWEGVPQELIRRPRDVANDAVGGAVEPLAVELDRGTHEYPVKRKQDLTWVPTCLVPLFTAVRGWEKGGGYRW